MVETTYTDAVSRALLCMTEVMHNSGTGKYEYSHLGMGIKNCKGQFDSAELAQQHLHRAVVPIAIQIAGGDFFTSIRWNIGRDAILPSVDAVLEEVSQYFLTHA